MSKETMKLKTAAEKVVELCGERPLSLGKWFIDMSEACESLREALAEQPAQQEPVAMRMPKVGDEVICIEDESLGMVAYLTAGGSPEIRFDDGSHGTYVLREFAELFRYTTPQPAQQEYTSFAEWANDYVRGLFTHKEVQPELKRFADLVRADECEQGQKWFDAVTAQHKQAILTEREACAKVCESEWSNVAERMYGEECAAAIRARSKT